MNGNRGTLSRTGMNPARAAAPGEGRKVVPDSGSAGAPKLGGRELGGKRMNWRRRVKGRTGCRDADGAEVLAADDLYALLSMAGERRKPQGQGCIRSNEGPDEMGVFRLRGFKAREPNRGRQRRASVAKRSPLHARLGGVSTRGPMAEPRFGSAR